MVLMDNIFNVSGGVTHAAALISHITPVNVRASHVCGVEHTHLGVRDAL